MAKELFEAIAGGSLAKVRALVEADGALLKAIDDDVRLTVGPALNDHHCI